MLVVTISWKQMIIASPALFVQPFSLIPMFPSAPRMRQSGRASRDPRVGGTFRRTSPPLALSFSEEDAGYDDEENEDDDDEEDDDSDEHSTFPQPPSSWALANDFEIFLNQCAIQSFLFLVQSMRDPQTVFWLEDFTQPAITLPKMLITNDTLGQPKSSSILLNYHGLAAINTTLFPTWGSYFAKLLEQPIETTRIESSSRYIPSYDLEINPPRLCSRIISVREQVAMEFVKDLGVIERMGEMTLERYWESLRELRSRTESQAENEGRNTSAAAVSLHDEPVRFQRENLLFLEFSADDESSDEAPSPLRKGNFDLLVLLATQEAIHRFLNRERKSPADQASHYFLRNFYWQRLDSHFTGSKRYGRADDFLEDLLQQAPRMIQVPTGRDETVTSLIDPLSIAERILIEREQVARDWRESARNVPQAHMQIKRMQLNLLMGIPANATSSSAESSHNGK